MCQRGKNEPRNTITKLSINSANLCLSVCLAVCLSVCLSVGVNLPVCNSVCVILYLAYLANRSYHHLCARPVCCTGPDNMHCQVWGCFDASKLYIWLSFGAGHVNVYPPPFAIFRVRIGRQVAHLGPRRTIYNYKEANLSVSVCGDGLYSHRSHPNGHMH